jgi:hypothetical protein
MQWCGKGSKKKNRRGNVDSSGENIKNRKARGALFISSVQPFAFFLSFCSALLSAFRPWYGKKEGSLLSLVQQHFTEAFRRDGVGSFAFFFGRKSPKNREDGGRALRPDFPAEGCLSIFCILARFSMST